MEKIIRDCLIEYNLNIPGTAWEDPYLDKFSEYYKDINGDYYIAFWNGELAGGCGYGPLPNETGTCELQKLYIKKELRKYGIGQALVDKVEKEYQLFMAKERAEQERKEATLETYAKEKEELNHSFKTFLEVNSQKQKAGMVLSASSFLIMVIVLLTTLL